MSNLRKCTVNNIPAYFHRWSDKSYVVSPSSFTGGHNGGVTKLTVGIIEYEDGMVHECYPNEIKFVDRPSIVSEKRALTEEDIVMVIDNLNKINKNRKG